MNKYGTAETELYRKAGKVDALARSYPEGSKQREKLHDKSNQMRDNARDLGRGVFKASPSALKDYRDSNERRFPSLKHKVSKQQWMEQHGNKGMTPEEVYQPNRYLKTQNLYK